MTDFMYEKERNKLIPEAVRFANSIHGELPPQCQSGSLSDGWSRTFHLKMNELACSNGLCSYKTVVKKRKTYPNYMSKSLDWFRRHMG